MFAKGANDDKVRPHREGKKLDGRSALAVYLSVTTGHCWGLGLIFAGTGDLAARDTLLSKLKMLQAFRENKSPPFQLSFTPDSKRLRPLVESCLCTVALALSCVMAGTGDLDSLRILRALRWKVDEVSYGTHLSLAMAIGLLFLSGGRGSLRRDPEACACLMMATAPRFPSRTVDNQFHVQALRHLYVLAVESRALHVVDSDTGGAVALDVEIELMDGQKIRRRAPCLLPELASVRAVHFPQSGIDAVDADYFPTSLSINGAETEAPCSNLNSADEDGNTSGASRKKSPAPSIPHPFFVKKRTSTFPSRSHDTSRSNRSSPGSVALLASRLAGSKGQVTSNARLLLQAKETECEVVSRFSGLVNASLLVPSAQHNGAAAFTHKELANSLVSSRSVMSEFALHAVTTEVRMQTQ